ncbi:MAG: Hsp20/alpha crystallin family protein, partial [Anaerolineae bacterium]|nr:Hsp20/alpha crystallin family protein [Anaerolineae bacterium]
MRWNPQSNVEVTDPFRAIESMFEDMWRGWPARFQTDTARPMLRPAMDVIENDNAVTLRVDLPGLSVEDVNVELDDNTLTVSGEIGDTIEEDGDRYHYRERYTGSFQRSLRLPNTIDAEKVEANFENGVLNIVLPKLPQAQPKRIEVKGKKK